MNTRTPPFPIASWARAAALASMAVLSAQAATPAQDIETSFRQDRAACMSETSMHERGSCLREAAAVRSEARCGLRAASATPETHRHNALRRCVELPAEQRGVCERMVQGEGVTSGSVEGGGLLRALETEVVNPTR